MIWSPFDETRHGSFARRLVLAPRGRWETSPSMRPRRCHAADGYWMDSVQALAADPSMRPRRCHAADDQWRSREGMPPCAFNEAAALSRRGWH